MECRYDLLNDKHQQLLAEYKSLKDKYDERGKQLKVIKRLDEVIRQLEEYARR